MAEVTFSVIVVSLNAEMTISGTLDSILGQTYNDYEIIIKDGGSKDCTLDCVPVNPKIKVYVETDKSVYSAMNQALRYVNGKYVIFMNCGDTFYNPDVLKNVAKVIEDKQLDGKNVLYGNYAKNNKCYEQSGVIDRKYLIKSGLCHQTVFFGKLVFDQIGGFDEEMKICADYEIMVRAYCHGVNYIYINQIICEYLGGGLSERRENLSLVAQEGALVRKRYFSVRERVAYMIRRVKRRIFRGENNLCLI